MHRSQVSPVAAIALSAAFCVATTAFPAELIQLTSENFDQIVPAGKETDAIYGDWVLRNADVTAVIANPVVGRKANMTVRGVGGMLIDFTTRHHGSDQLSCFYPAGGRYLFEDPQTLRGRIDDGPEQMLDSGSTLHGGSLSVIVTGISIADDKTEARVTYTVSDEQPWLSYRVELMNRADGPVTLRREDALRCDGNLFQTGALENGGFFAEDRYFGQCYGFLVDEHSLRNEAGRSMPLVAGEPESIASGETLAWDGSVFCSQGLPGIRSLMLAATEVREVHPVSLLLKCPQGGMAHAQVAYQRGQEELGLIQTDANGFARTHLPSGLYTARISAIGHEPREHQFEVSDRPRSDTLSFESPSRVRGRISDAAGSAIAAKIQFQGLEGTADPDFGPDSAIYAIKNVVYCARGSFEQPLDAGHYRVIISHGPEYDADIQEIEVLPGQLVQLSSSLPRTVDTTGWVSTEFHSHSSPSGDNVSHQTGRVLNLLAEQLEFAPCTEHNRIDTYADDLELLGATHAMATCSGMELTGGPLPINHQNAFPLQMHVHEQDGGGPQTDADPVKQIERLALWDNSSSKVVQSNHPDIASILGDRDLDGQPDEGFRGMLGWMDVIEVHPPEKIFDFPAADVAAKDKRSNPIFHWLQLLNLGYRIPGVVNTDAHYNFHGSGWLRNYLRSSTDNPAEISLAEMIHSSEHGHSVMTTGPFLEFELKVVSPAGETQRFGVGEDVDLRGASASMWIRVQCPNWFDVNRVQIFANGRPLESANFTRKTHPSLFKNDYVRFELETALPALNEDTHFIAAAIGEGLKLGPVMGPDAGERPPVAVTNPIFVDIDGSGFQPNGDNLGVPFMVDTGSSEN
ncbi:MAG: CehA/McbA family metallohydrolase [bacterium]|nr:CehA/McbA family metallohydrolase [bacterium]